MPQDLIVYTDGSVISQGGGFTVKQVAATIHEDSAACEIKLQLDNGNGSSHTFFPLDCLER